MDDVASRCLGVLGADKAVLLRLLEELRILLEGKQTDALCLEVLRHYNVVSDNHSH